MPANLTTKLGQLVDVLTPDTTNTRIGVANASPTRTLDVTGTGGFSGNLNVGGTSNVATGTIGIGVTNNAAVLVDGRLDANTNTYGYRFVNGSAGTAATTLGILGNGTNALQLTMFGTAYTTSTIYRQGGAALVADGPGGLTFVTQAVQPIYFAIDSVEKMRLDTSGRLQVGTSVGGGRINMGNSGGGIQQINSTGGAQEILNLFSDDNLYFSGPSNIIIRPGGGGEAARFDTGGRLLVGGSSVVFSGKLEVSYSGASFNGIAIIETNNTSSVAFLPLLSNGTVCGQITRVGATAAVVYTTTSDYRLKENVNPMTNGLNIISALNPVTYDWIDSKASAEGFIAHELQAVIPDAVAGEKDAVNEDGSIKPQGVDFGKIVPHLVAAMQEQQATIQELTTRLAALENK